MEMESESSISGDDSVFWLDSEVITQLTDGEEGEREEIFRKMKSSVHSEEDDFVPELHRNVHPRERPDWEETLSAMARGADVPEIPGDLTLKTCGNTASMKVKHVKKSTTPGLMGCDNIHRLPFTKGHFPKMAECAHFHYENVEFGSIQLSLSEEQNEIMKNGCESKELVYLVQIACQGKSWIVKRSYEDFRVLDKHLHLCIYDRRFSQLSELPRSDSLKDSPESVTQMLMAYLSRLSAIAGNKINCGPALTWMEIDNKGNHLLVHEESSINTPAVGAAHVIKRYTARAPDELTLEVGDIVSVIDMPPKVLSTWWRGKHGFQVGLFPGHCVELINQKIPQSVTNSVPKPVSKKHGKLITFLRTFMKSRPTKQKLKQRGILKERVFGCDLGEHLLNSGFEVPQVLQSCTAFIERYGIVDGIYRLSGVASNIQRLRHEFDSEHVPDLTKEPYVQDIHSVGSLCKLYFRELPNPLLTYQLYEKFSDAVSAATDEERLIKIHDVIQQLPPPHYRTLEFLMRHLSLLADYCSITNMHAKNLAIVWAPNLLRSKQIESACFSGTAAFMEVRIQSVVVEFILNHVDVLFSGKISAVMQEGAASLSRPKSLLVSSPSTKLLTLEEAQARTQAQVNSPIVTENKYIEVGEGPAALQGKFHTIIEFPLERKRPQNKMKKSPVGSWRSFFNLGKSSSVSKRKLQRNESEPSEMKAMALKGGRAEGTLRSAKSEESLTSLHAVDGDSKLFRPRRPRSSSDALSASFNGEMLGNRCNSYDNLPHDNESEEEVGLLHIPALLSPHSAEDVDLSPPDIGVASLDFDPMSFQCSPPKAESECLESGASFLDSLGYSKDKPCTSKKDVEPGGSQSQTPGSTASSEPVSPVQEKLSPFFTLDLSPTEEKSSKSSSFTEKVVYAFSPKIGRKLSKSPSMNISEPISVTLPPRVSEAISTGSNTAAQNASSPTWDKSPEESDVTNRSPTQIVKMKTNEREAQEGCEPEIQPLDQVAAEEIELPGKEERSVSSSQSKAVASGQTQTGAVTHDPPQEPVPVSSVSLIPPPPPPKNVARMLALALAESAQQASTQSLKRPGTSQAGYTNYGDIAGATAEDKLPSPYSSISLDKAYFQTDRPAEQFHLQNNALGNCNQPLPETTAVGDPTHTKVNESGEQLHQVDLPGNHLHRNYLSGDPEKARITLVPLTDSEKSDDHVGFPEDQAGKTTVATIPFVEQDQSALHFYSEDQSPAYLGASVDQPHHPSELADQSSMPSNLPRDKSCPLSGSPEENTSTATMTYMTATPATAEISTRDASWAVSEQPTATGFAVATLQRTHRSHRPLPPPPAQRTTEQLPVAGQVQAATSIGLNNSHKVHGVVPAPERPPEPRAVDDPAPIFVSDSCAAAAQCPMVTTTLQPGLPEKVRESTRAPLLHMRAESFPGHSCGFSAPMPPTRTMESKMAAAMHSNSADATSSSNYHSFVTASSASVDDVLPLPLPVPQPKHASQKIAYSSFARPDVTAEPFGPENCLHFNMTPNCQFRPQSVPPHHNKLEQHQVYGARSEPPASMGPRYNTYVAPGRNTSGHHSKPCNRMEYVSSLSSSVRNACYPEDIPPYPTIRRVQSLHAPPSSMIRSVPISRTEVPPDDEPAYCPRPLYQFKPYQSSQARSDYHVTQLQPYFENGRVHYRYSPYSSSSSSYYSPDGALCDVDAYSTVQLRPLHRLPSRDFAFYNPRLQGKNLYSYSGLPPRPRTNMTGYFSGNDHNVVNMPPPADVKHTYASWDLEDMEKYRMQSIRRESRARQKVKAPVMSQYDNMTPAVQDDLGGIYVIHLRSKSDPGKTGLLSVAEGKEGRHPAKAMSPEGDDRFYRKHPEPEFERAPHHGGYGSIQAEKPTLPQKQSSLRNRKLHDMGCSLPEHRVHQEASHRQLCESKNGPPYPQATGQLEYGPKTIPDTSEPGSYHNSGGKYTTGQESLRLNHKEVRLSKELERPRARQPPAPEKHSRDCYKEEEHLTQSMVPPPKPERSHSLKLHHTQNMERDPSVLYQYQTHSKRQSNMTVVSQYDNLEDYHSLPQHQRGGFGGGGMGTYVPSGFAHPQSRTYATALGQGAFLPTELSLPHPDTQIHAE
ncbi:Rho GTPase activating protein 32, transcript variant X1 [Ictidomys tridecemlineatus]|uniref:Rho GTPase-activating protein 32 n=3 Tax=Ictidomys tridecemlineatus TaxID=43179 RepID=A0A287D5U4_ICTTR|nr:rho GTPase-activating protein 32 isoform X1 [Ictidomys tridecemlineatus]KAG3286956.1 Rho GTPase activating protein 32, transcript variant X1 [Ictidomys tridecemlineatus]